jgi:hypothetical protein
MTAHQASSSEGSGPDDATEPRSPGSRTFGLAGLLVELVVPVAFSASVLLVMAGYTRYWDLRSGVGLGIFGFLLVALSLFVSLRVDALTLARRRERGKKQLLNRADARSRLVKFILGGVTIPIGAFAAANLLELPNHQTPMSVAIRLKLASPAVGRAEQLGNAVLRARSPAARVQGILALQAQSSDEALDQLLRILSDDPAALQDGGEYQALSRALASYRVRAKTKLLQRFEQMSPSARRGAPGPPGDLFERYFSAGFEGLKSEVSGGAGDPAMQARGLESLRAAQAELRQAVAQVETGTPFAQDGSLPGLVMQAFLQMDLKQDADLLGFARRTAADTAWSDAVRGQALLLIAKLGGKDDLDGLYAYLESPSALLQARAMQAIGALQSKLSDAAAASG